MIESEAAVREARWPELPWREWAPTISTLHMWTQVVGKVRMALAPPLNHWWHIPLYVGSRGLTTSPIPYRGLQFEVSFDFIDHRLVTAPLIRRVRDGVILPNGGVTVADQTTATERLVQDITRLGNSFAKWKEGKPNVGERMKVKAALKRLVALTA